MPTFFCRNCGQEHHPVVLVDDDEGTHRVLPRDIDETPLDDPDFAEKPGYLMPEPENDETDSLHWRPRRLSRGLARDGSQRQRHGCAATGGPMRPRR